MQALRIAACLLSLAGAAHAGWSQSKIPDMKAEQPKYGDDLSAYSITPTTRGFLADSGPLGDHAGVDGPYRVWNDIGFAVDYGTKVRPWASFRVTGGAEPVKLWFQQGSAEPILATSAYVSPLADCSSSVSLGISISSITEEQRAGLGLTPASGIPTALLYSGDRAGIDWSVTGWAAPVNDFHDTLTGSAAYFRDYGSIISYDSDVTPTTGTWTHLDTFDSGLITLWWQRGEATPVLAFACQPTEDAYATRVSTRVKIMSPRDEPLNPYPARLSGATGTISTGAATGYGVGGLPAGIVLDETIVKIENLAIDGEFATLLLFYAPDLVAPYGIEEESIRIYWYDDAEAQWVLAGNASNDAKNSNAAFVMGKPTSALGDWGLDMDGNYAWANIDHASTYGMTATPEPATLVLLALGAAWTTQRRRRVPWTEARASG